MLLVMPMRVYLNYDLRLILRVAQDNVKVIIYQQAPGSLIILWYMR